MELRTTPPAAARVAAVRGARGGLTLVGYAAVFDSPSEPMPFVETIAPGAFARSLAAPRRDVRMFLNHDQGVVLASRRAGTLRLREDHVGLRVEADLPDSEWGRPVAEALRRGDVHTMSFGFTVPRGGDQWQPDGTRRRLVHVDLLEVSPVTGWAAYPATSASVT